MKTVVFLRQRLLISLILCMWLLMIYPATATHFTATWTNADATENWSDPNNWDIGMVPLNEINTFDVTIPGGFTVYFDIDDPGYVTDLELASGSLLVVDPGHSLTLLDDVSLNGRVVSNGETTDLICTSAGATLGNGAQLEVSNGGTIECAATDYSSTSLTANTTLFSADGYGARLGLSSLQSLDARFTTNYRTQTISATNLGVIDLSWLGTLYGSNSSLSSLTIHVGSDGYINLYSLSDILGGYTKFDIDVPSYTLPSLVNATTTTFDISETSMMTFPSLETVSSCSFVIPDGGIINAPSLINFLGSQLTLNPSRTFINGGFVNMDNSRILLSEGAEFGVAYGDISAIGYSSTGLSSDVTLFSATGTGTFLDLSSFETFNAAFGANYRTQTVSATDNGLIDLSAVETLNGSASSLSRIKFHLATDGDIDLSSLGSIPSGYTTFDIDVPSYSLPALQSATGMTFDASNVTTIDLPVITSLATSSLVMANDATINAPNLTSFTNSSVTLNPMRTFINGGLSNLDNSRIILTDGAQFGTSTGDITATGYASTALGDDPTLFSATGAGTILDLSSFESFNAGFGANYRTQTVSANDNGIVDLSSVSTLHGSASSLSRIQFVADTGGEIDLTGLQDIPSGYTTFNIDISNFNLPAIETATGVTFDASGTTTIGLPLLTTLTNSQFVIADGGTIDAPMLTSLTSSILDLNPSRTFINGTLTNLDNTRITLAGGVEFGVATGDVDTTSYSSAGLSGNHTIFSVDGNGTVLDLSTLQSINAAFGGNYRTQIYSVTNQGTLDLSGLSSIVGAASSLSQTEFNVDSGALVLFGDLDISSYTELNINGSDSGITAEALTFNAPSRLAVTEGGTISLGGDFMYNVTASFNATAGIVEFISADPVQMEVGGQNLGLGGAVSGNFGMAQLIVGSAGQPTTLSLVDLHDNQSDGADNEALYLYGSGGMDGLRIHDGCQLIIGDIDLYVHVGEEDIHINSLFGPGVKWIPFDEGIITLTEYACSLSADLTGDCVVDLQDFSVMASEWLLCGDLDCP